MISAAAATARLVQRLRVRTERIVAARAAALRRSRRSSGGDWHSATALWPEFTADIGSSNRTGN
jgi:hypothetical protein